MEKTHDQDVLVQVKHVQELSINGVEPPPRYIRKEKDNIDAPINTTSIPIIDLHLLSSSSSQDKEKELEKFKRSWRKGAGEVQISTKKREILNEYSMKTRQTAEIILKNMAKVLNLEENYFIHVAADNAPTFARFNYFQPCLRPDLVYGIKPHADGGAITIVLPDKEVEGLQVLKDGQWIKVPNHSGCTYSECS
ncbi:1-aminocyclopropane-1-carboxylate oxidase [Thalictrum thalictroides]|uniref:1-aminocyclopropane-1-carboxylate oxidase n=1 Tax=Thalictrum thalictroides TaxID=46969 RepID=A0A7J6VBQ0_THATH|nr:1-aminocyclopropane-1-carboxylate oxidase [Thalictrum thalictroides]